MKNRLPYICILQRLPSLLLQEGVVYLIDRKEDSRERSVVFMLLPGLVGSESFKNIMIWASNWDEENLVW